MDDRRYDDSMDSKEDVLFEHLFGKEQPEQPEQPKVEIPISEVKDLSTTPVYTKAQEDDRTFYRETVRHPAPEQKKHRKVGAGKYVAVACLVVAVGAVSFRTGMSAGNHFKADAQETMNASSAQSAALETSESNASFTSAAMGSPLSAANNNVASVVKAVEDSIVSINVKAEVYNMFYRPMESTQAGSGIIFAEDDEKIYIVTNYHVISGANECTISIDDDKQASANFVGSDSSSDLAVISVTKAALKEAGVDQYKIAKFGDSDGLSVGESVVAIGNALGEGKSATLGIISTKAKEISVGQTTLKMIQTDAAINPGNSGGALVNAKGEVIGINTAKLSSAGIEGMGYSIPANEAKQIMDEIMTNGTVERALLGVQEIATVTKDMQLIYGFPTQGVYVGQVASDSGADKGGLKAGDLIVGFGDKKVETTEELAEFVSQANPGDTFTIYIFRGSQPMKLEVTLGAVAPESNF